MSTTTIASPRPAADPAPVRSLFDLLEPRTPADHDAPVVLPSRSALCPSCGGTGDNELQRDGRGDGTPCRLCTEPDDPRLLDRFWEKVDKSAGPNGCWTWMAWKSPSGYGRFYFTGKNVQAHRFIYERMVGPIPDGFEVDHVKARGCTSPACVNPTHLEAVPPAVNRERSDNPAVVNSRKSTCIHGHPFTPENTYVHRGKRSCRACIRVAVRTYRARCRARKQGITQ